MGKVIFSQASVSSWGGGLLLELLPGMGLLPELLPWASDTPSDQTSPSDQAPTSPDKTPIHPQTRRLPPPPPEMATAAVGTHPTGMHSC